MKTNPNDSAFSRPAVFGSDGGSSGLTKREYFAAMAMQGFCSFDPPSAPDKSAILAMCAIEMADALISELNKELEVKKWEEK